MTEVKGEANMGKTILIVEDDLKNLKLIRDLLQHDGYATLEATDGGQAVELAKDKKPDLILMDIQLPTMNGLEATRILKADTANKDIPIVALTAYAMEEDEKEALEAGCDGFMRKPIEVREFLKQVAQYL